MTRKGVEGIICMAAGKLRFTHSINQVKARLDGFADGLVGSF